MPQSTLTPVGPVNLVPLFPGLHQQLMALLRGLEPADWVKPVELIELLQRRTAKRRQVQAPTSSPFYDADFVAKHRKNKRKRRNTAD